MVFDDFTDSKKPYEDRVAAVEDRVYKILPCKLEIYYLLPRIVFGMLELQDFEQKSVTLGYEGVMIRDPAGPYKLGRSTTKDGYLLKIKRFHDTEGVVIGFEELMHNDNALETDERGYAKRVSKKAGKSGGNTLGALRVFHNGVEFKIGTGFTDTVRSNIWCSKDKYLGKLVKFKYQGFGSLGAPRFPVFLSFRDEMDI